MQFERRRFLSIISRALAGTALLPQLAVTNPSGSGNNFGYLLMKHARSPKFSIEHPIHQPPYNPSAARIPFDAQNRFKAQNILYTPLEFRSKKIGGSDRFSTFSEFTCQGVQ